METYGLREKERVLKALANRRRLSILVFLKKRREATVGDIAEHIGLSLKATSKHLSILASSNLVLSTQRGLYMYYSIDSKLSSFARKIISSL